MLTVQEIIIESKLKRHILFCLAVSILLSLGVYLFYVAGFRFESISLIGFKLLVFLLYVYTGRWLCGKWYLKSRLIPAVVYALFVSFGIALADFFLTKYVFDHPNAGFIELLYGSMPFYLAGLVMGMLLKLVSFSVQKRIQEAQIRAEQKESEFNLLQSQLSPHFLFNVLNNLYGISIEEHQRIPQLLLKLSNLLRYSVYGAKKNLVPL
ncbi:MAG TPA: histidine kinase, partial [Mucilaginibacter sp.]|nr:histidine kinase [Mucilaginibacter sp.]